MQLSVASLLLRELQEKKKKSRSKHISKRFNFNCLEKYLNLKISNLLKRMYFFHHEVKFHIQSSNVTEQKIR